MPNDLTKTAAMPHHEAAFADLRALLTRHAGHLDAAEMLAIAANLVGKLVALQDQRTMTSAQAMVLVARNIEAGNREAVARLSSAGGRPN